VDVFTPVVDDPYTFGRIVAANCMSDVWAMGGDALTALNLFGYPTNRLAPEAAALILRGCADTVREAGVLLCGGHTWVDNDVKAGLAVTGTIHPQRIVTNRGARPGDALVLTKPVGGGILTYAAVEGKACDALLDPVVRSMVLLNRDASAAMRGVQAHAATDVTGFSLLGHAAVMAQASGVGMEIWIQSVPIFPGALELAEGGLFLPLGKANEDSFGDCVDFDPGISKGSVRVLFDPQTSGGLLVAVEDSKKDIFLERLHKKGIASARVVGKATHARKGRIQVH
jgi:selenide,water dikinase